MSISRELSGDGRTGRRAGRLAGGFGGGSLRPGVVVLVAAAVVVSACGSSSEESASTPKPAGAQENAVTSAAVCYSWPNGTTDAQPCAVGLKGPGGGRVFYDAGSVQPWGRFLEVAPQAWGGTLYSCRSCGAASGVTQQTSDLRDCDTCGGSLAYTLCADDSATYDVLLPGEAAATGKVIGDGRRNTEVFFQTTECAKGSRSAVRLVVGHRGGGLADWYVPSLDELVALCKYEGRNAIGGFVGTIALGEYVSSSSSYEATRNIGGSKFTSYYTVNFRNAPDCPQENANTGSGVDATSLRPIRAFA